jgi:hypothetical protein
MSGCRPKSSVLAQSKQTATEAQRHREGQGDKEKGR